MLEICSLEVKTQVVNSIFELHHLLVIPNVIEKVFLPIKTNVYKTKPNRSIKSEAIRVLI